MKVAFVASHGERKLDVPDTWPVPRVGEAVTFCDGASALVVDVLYAYPRNSPMVIVIRISEEARSCSTLAKN